MMVRSAGLAERAILVEIFPLEARHGETFGQRFRRGLEIRAERWNNTKGTKSTKEKLKATRTR